MILPASCSCNHYSLARFPTVTEICHAMCIRSPPLLSHRSACTAPTAREWLSANKSTPKQTNLTSSQPNMNSHHIAQKDGKSVVGGKSVSVRVDYGGRGK